MEGKTARGASSPANPALHIPGNEIIVINILPKGVKLIVNIVSNVNTEMLKIIILTSYRSHCQQPELQPRHHTSWQWSRWTNLWVQKNIYAAQMVAHKSVLTLQKTLKVPT